jgi:predicted MFS family arabinose efflux permease
LGLPAAHTCGTLFGMKKLAALVVAVGSLAIAAPVFACPHADHAEAAGPQTADKAKAATPATPATPAQTPAKDAKAEPPKKS